MKEGKKKKQTKFFHKGPCPEREKETSSGVLSGAHLPSNAKTDPEKKGLVAKYGRGET